MDDLQNHNALNEEMRYLEGDAILMIIAGR